MAALAHTSPRHLTRLFLEYGQIAPLPYLCSIRLAVAQTALASGDLELAAQQVDRLQGTQGSADQVGAPGNAIKCCCAE